jgi:hypothetical protein
MVVDIDGVDVFGKSFAFFGAVVVFLADIPFDAGVVAEAGDQLAVEQIPLGPKFPLSKKFSLPDSRSDN